MSTTQPLADLADMVRERAKSRGNAIAFEFEGRVTSFAEFDIKTNRVANALIAMGVNKGERIAYLGKNSDNYFELLMGAMKAGVVMAPVNWRLAGPEVAFIVSDCKAPVLFVGPEFITQVRQIKDQLPGVRSVITTEGGAPEWQDFTAWRDAQSGDDPKVPIDTKDIAIQLYTSGTTGKPKGAMLSHANFLNLVQTGNAEDKPEWNRWSTDDVSLVAMPIFHIGGSGWGVMGLYHGARGVIAREFDPTKVLDFFEQSGITKLFMVPAAMQFVVRQPRAKTIDFSRLKYMLYGASPIPAALLKECIEIFKCGFVQMYGMTETTGTIVALPPEDHIEGLERMRSAGKALPGVEIAILDVDGKPLPPREVGEIATRSGSNMAGYWNLPEATAATLRGDGWLRTGDAGYMDEDRLSLHPRPHQGHDHLRGRKHLPGRGRERAVRSSRRRGSCRDRYPRRQMGRGGEGRGGDEARQAGDRHRHHQLHARAHRRLQDAEERGVFAGAAAQSLRQDFATAVAGAVLGGEG
ncbi:acyl-CoA synthetase (AMP-forming)/AMP-acid ligase II [Bradyrhizobium sp. GM0.4]